MGTLPRRAMPEEFEVLEHTADLGFRAYGNSLAELFANCALALSAIAFELAAVQPLHACPLRAEGADRESLLVNWLSEVLFRLDADRLAFCRFEVHSLTDTGVEGTGWGEPRQPGKPPARVVVKGVTYHQLRLLEHDGKWMAEVFLDI